jgi:transcriptional regulator
MRYSGAHHGSASAVYIPQHFQEERPEVLARAIRDIQFALLVTAMDGDYLATHLPMIVKHAGGAFTLEAHVARANAHWTVLGSKPASLAVFQGPQTYVSPSWYETKRQHGKVVPTWNYVVVHAHGTLEVVEDRDWLLAHLGDLVGANESSREQPWAIADAPAEFIQGMTRAIVGLRFTIDRLEGKWKMIQNRSEADRLGTMAGLSASAKPEDQAVAAVMRALEMEKR